MGLTPADSIKDDIRRILDDGTSLRTVAADTEITKSTFSRYLKRYREEGGGGCSPSPN